MSKYRASLRGILENSVAYNVNFKSKVEPMPEASKLENVEIEYIR